MKKYFSYLYLPIGFLFVTFFLWGNIFGGSINFNPHVGTDDLMDTNLPFRKILNESYLEGKVPLWSNLISSGYPILAEGQIAALYPVNLLTIKFDPHISVLISLFLCYFLIFIFTYLFLRRLNLGEIPCYLGAIVATFSGFPANQIQHLGMLTSYTYFIIILFIIERYRENFVEDHRSLELCKKTSAICVLKKNIETHLSYFKQYLLAGVALGLSLLGGHPQIVFYSLIFIYPYWFFRKIFNIEKEETLTKKPFDKKMYRQKNQITDFMIGLVIFTLVGIGIGAGQIIPQFEFTQNSTRNEGLSEESAARYALKSSDIKTLISPFINYSTERSIAGFANNGWPRDEMYIFIGIIPVLLSGVTLFFVKRNRSVLFFWITIVFAFLFSMGGNSIFGTILTVPPFSYFRIPFRISFLISLSFAYLSALGFEKLTDKKVMNALTVETTDQNYKKIRIAAGFFLFAFAFINMKDNFRWLYFEVDSDNWYKEPEAVAYVKDNLKNNERVASELYFFASYPYFLENPSIWNDPETHRNLRNLLPPFNNVLYNVPQNVGAANSGGLKIDRYNELEAEVYFNGFTSDDEGNIKVSDSFLFLNRIMGVKYILSNKKFSSHVTSPIKEIQMPTGEAPVYIYEFFDYFPRQFLVPKAVKEEPEKIKEHLFKADFQPLQEIFIEEDANWGAKGGYSANSSFVKYEDTEVVIKTQASGDGFLFLSDTYYPGWNAYVDGNKETIYRANYAFRAVKVPEGEHEVIFRYEPDSFKWGISITIITGALSLLGFFLEIILRKLRLCL